MKLKRKKIKTFLTVVRLLVCSLESLAQKIPQRLQLLVDARQILLIPVNKEVAHRWSHIYGDRKSPPQRVLQSPLPTLSRSKLIFVDETMHLMIFTGRLSA